MLVESIDRKSRFKSASVAAERDSNVAHLFSNVFTTKVGTGCLIVLYLHRGVSFGSLLLESFSQIVISKIIHTFRFDPTVLTGFAASTGCCSDSIRALREEALRQACMRSVMGQ
jgi:hypothetical protein